MVVIDCVPILYYLQYLLYSQKGNLPKRLLAMFNLMDYVIQFVFTDVRKGKGGRMVFHKYFIRRKEGIWRQH